jgi:hypothetical protein
MTNVYQRTLKEVLPTSEAKVKPLLRFEPAVSLTD